MIVDMRTVSMGGDDKGVFSFQKSLGKFIANLVSFFGCHFSRPERLPYLIGNHIAFLPAPGGLFIKSLCQHKFFVYCQGTALIAADKFTLLGFVWVLDIAGVVIQTGGNGLPLILRMAINRVAASSITSLKRKCRHIGGIKIIWIFFRNRQHPPDTLPYIGRIPTRCRFHLRRGIASMILG